MKILILTLLVIISQINCEINVLSSCNQADNLDGVPNLNITVNINIGGGSNQNIIKGDSCGVTISSKSGSEPYEGQFPFNVIIYKSTFASTTYECQGVLISKNVVLTSAICMTNGQPRDLKRYVLYMGKYNFLSWENALQRSIKNLILHPQFNPATYYADIAIIKLDRNVVFSDYVRPACLWNLQTDINSLVGMEGTVPGWDYDSEVYTKEELSHIKMRVASSQECVLNSYLKKSVTSSDSIFCAGYKTDVTCKGDDGAGLFFHQEGKWILRGINSISVGYQDEVICDSKHFAAFTDVVPFIKWIESYL